MNKWFKFFSLQQFFSFSLQNSFVRDLRRKNGSWKSFAVRPWWHDFQFLNCQNLAFQTVKNFLFKLSNFLFQTVKIFLFKLSKISFSKLSNFPFQTVKNFVFKTVKFSFSNCQNFSFPNCQIMGNLIVPKVK